MVRRGGRACTVPAPPHPAASHDVRSAPQSAAIRDTLARKGTLGKLQARVRSDIFEALGSQEVGVLGACRRRGLLPAGALARSGGWPGGGAGSRSPRPGA